MFTSTATRARTPSSVTEHYEPRKSGGQSDTRQTHPSRWTRDHCDLLQALARGLVVSRKRLGQGPEYAVIENALYSALALDDLVQLGFCDKKHSTLTEAGLAFLRTPKADTPDEPDSPVLEQEYVQAEWENAIAA